MDCRVKPGNDYKGGGLKGLALTRGPRDLRCRSAETL
jgi:hypothetical protein